MKVQECKDEYKGSKLKSEIVTKTVKVFYTKCWNKSSCSWLEAGVFPTLSTVYKTGSGPAINW